MKIMKKLFSFVCCLFLAVSCFAPFAHSYHTPLRDGEYCRFALHESVDGSGVYLTTKPGFWAWACGGARENGWFTAHRRGDKYILAIGKYATLIERTSQVLDEYFRTSSNVWAYKENGGTNQLWHFEREEDTEYVRIYNNLTGYCLTYDCKDKFVYARPYIDRSESDYCSQLWKITRDGSH